MVGPIRKPCAHNRWWESTEHFSSYDGVSWRPRSNKGPHDLIFTWCYRRVQLFISQFDSSLSGKLLHVHLCGQRIARQMIIFWHTLWSQVRSVHEHQAVRILVTQQCQVSYYRGWQRTCLKVKIQTRASFVHFHNVSIFWIAQLFNPDSMFSWLSVAMEGNQWMKSNESEHKARITYSCLISLMRCLEMASLSSSGAGTIRNMGWPGATFKLLKIMRINHPFPQSGGTGPLALPDMAPVYTRTWTTGQSSRIEKFSSWGKLGWGDYGRQPLVFREHIFQGYN